MSNTTDMAKSPSYTTADAMMAALQDAGVSYIFANFGSDHAGIIESLAKAGESGRALPTAIMCPHEGVAIAAAQGYAQVSGRGQAVFVHVDVGLQNLGGGLHNAMRGRIPVFLFAGLTPYTIEGELPGTRNRPAMFLQDMFDQGSVVRPYVKWEYAIHTGKNVRQLVNRALQLAESEPKGPVYLAGAREVLEEEVEPSPAGPRNWRPIEAGALSDEGVAEIAEALSKAKNPLVITSYLGRNTGSVAELVRLCERLALPVIDERPLYMNFPADHPLHMGYQSGKSVAEADVILVLDCDMPWTPVSGGPKAGAKVFHVDIDPLKERIPVWYIEAERFIRADSGVVLKQLNRYFDSAAAPDESARAKRLAAHADAHAQMRARWRKKEERPASGVISAEWLMACLREVTDEDTLFMNEAVTNAGALFNGLPRNRPGTLFNSGGSSLGWGGGAALGAKLAAPDRDVVCLTGDGSFFFSNPSTVYWMSRRYKLPFLTIVLNNRGWNATKQNVLRLHPEGAASRGDGEWVGFNPSADFAKIAEAAGGAHAQTVEHADALPDALREAMSAIRQGRSAVIDVRMTPISD